MRGLLPSLCAVLAVLTAAPAFAQRGDSLGADWGPQQSQARQGVREGHYVPLKQVTATVAARVPGRLLDAGLEQDAGGREVYRVRWAAADGRRLDVIVDAASGQIVRQEGR